MSARGSLPCLILGIGPILAVGGASEPALADHYRAVCSTRYNGVYVRPRYVLPARHTARAGVYVEYVNPPIHVRYRTYVPRIRHHHHHGISLKRVIRRLFHDDDRDHRFGRHGYDGRYGHGHHYRRGWRH